MPVESAWPRCPRAIDDAVDYDRTPSLEMAQHLLTCEECREVLAIVRQVRDAVGDDAGGSPCLGEDRGPMSKEAPHS